MIRLDPWKRIDKDIPFDEPELVFRYNKKVNIPNNETIDRSFKPKLFSPDKIKSV